MELHEIRLDEEPCFAGARAAYHKDIFVPRCFWVLWPAVHRKPLRLRQDHVVCKHRIDVGRDILRRAPSCGPVFRVLPVLLRVLALYIHRQPQEQRTGDADAEIDGVEARRKAPKGKGKALQDMEGCSGNTRPRRVPDSLPDLCEQQGEEDIREVG